MKKDTKKPTGPAAIDAAILHAEAMLTYYHAEKKAPGKVLPFRTRAAAARGAAA